MERDDNSDRLRNKLDPCKNVTVNVNLSILQAFDIKLISGLDLFSFISYIFHCLMQIVYIKRFINKIFGNCETSIHVRMRMGEPRIINLDSSGSDHFNGLQAREGV